MGIEKIAAKIATNYCKNGIEKLPNISKLAGKTITPLKYKYKSGVEKAFESIQKMQGMEGSTKFTKAQLKLLPEHVQKMLAPLLEGTQNPVTRISYKTKPNYNVAGIKVTDGDRVVGTGAISITNPGKADGVLKARLNVPGKVEANGFIDGTKPMDSYDVSSSLVRRGGKIKADIQTTAAGLRVNGDENAIQKLLMPVGEGSPYGFRAKYSELTHRIQSGFDDFGSEIRYFLRGNKSV